MANPQYSWMVYSGKSRYMDDLEIPPISGNFHIFIYFHIFSYIFHIFSYSDSSDVIWCPSQSANQVVPVGPLPTAFATPLVIRRWPVAPCAALRALRRRIFAMSAMTWEPPQIENSRTLLSHLFKHWSIEIHFLFEGRMRATWSLTLGLTNRKNEMRGTSAKRTWVLCFSDFIKKTKL
jgi:hypothetical protein